MAQIAIRNLRELDKLGKIVSDNLPFTNFPPIFLHGQLGAGKTSFVKAVVSHMQGAKDAEIGSPSFNIYNIYPTEPNVCHCDLYRGAPSFPEEIMDILERDKYQLFVEWAEFFPTPYMPQDYLDISFKLAHYERLLEINSFGHQSGLLLEAILKYFQPQKNPECVSPGEQTNP